MVGHQRAKAAQRAASLAAPNADYHQIKSAHELRNERRHRSVRPANRPLDQATQQQQAKAAEGHDADQAALDRHAKPAGGCNTGPRWRVIGRPGRAHARARV